MVRDRQREADMTYRAVVWVDSAVLYIFETDTHAGATPAQAWAHLQAMVAADIDPARAFAMTVEYSTRD